jgi:Ni/Fe-hydrogenase subunit HybB-like protein
MGWARLQRWAKRIMAPVTIIGVTLSTLHQSTLGTLYLNMPYRLDPRWYTPLLPLLFYVSSIAAGLSMAVIAYRLATRIHHVEEDRGLIQGLGVGAACVALLYVALRLFALWSDGALSMLLADNLLNRLLVLELAFGAIIPAVLILIPAFRRQSWVQWAAPLFMLGGVGLNRFDATLFAQHGPQQVALYVPHIMEWLSAIGILAGAALVWYVGVRYLVSLRSR